MTSSTSFFVVRIEDAVVGVAPRPLVSRTLGDQQRPPSCVLLEGWDAGRERLFRKRRQKPESIGLDGVNHRNQGRAGLRLRSESIHGLGNYHLVSLSAKGLLDYASTSILHNGRGIPAECRSSFECSSWRCRCVNGGVSEAVVVAPWQAAPSRVSGAGPSTAPERCIGDFFSWTSIFWGGLS